MKSAAEAFLQAATQAPQPMHCAASIAVSATSLATGMALASGADPVLTDDVAAGRDDAVEGAAIDDQVLDDGKAVARQGSTVIVSPSLKRRMCSWQTRAAAIGPVRRRR